MAHSKEPDGPGRREEQGSDKYLPWVAGPVLHEEEQMKPGEPQAHGRTFPNIAKQIHDSDYGILKLFFDLWFVANLQVFTSVKDVSKIDDLYSFVGFLTILWFTWFLVGAFDIRFSRDSIFDRTIRTIHFGVLVGFSIVVTHFDPDNQDDGTFQALSWVLMVSRLTLALQYGIVFVYIREYDSDKFPVLATAIMHFIAALVYLGISFRFDPFHNSRVFVVWYIGSFLEAVIALGLSYKCGVLSFACTPIAERLTVLTVMLLGEGVTDIAESVSLIVNKGRWWTPATIGVLISAIGTLYFVFMIYFDWMERDGLKGLRQLFYVMLHFPFHICLLLMGVGSTQFLMWWKAIEVNRQANQDIRQAIDSMNVPNGYANASSLVAETLLKTGQDVFKSYRPTSASTEQTLYRVVEDIKMIPVGYWNNSITDAAVMRDLHTRVERNLHKFLYTVSNSLFASFEIDPIQEMVDRNETGSKSQEEIYLEIGVQYAAVYRYTFVCAGTVLLAMVALHALTKKAWKWPLEHIRVLLSSLLGLGLILLSTLDRNFIEKKEGLYSEGTFRGSPWLLPTICLVFFTVMVLTHLRIPSSIFTGQKPGKANNGGSSELRDLRGAYMGVTDEESSINSTSDLRPRRGQTV